MFPIDTKTGLNIPGYQDYVETWKAMEELQRKGLTKSIGVSNFNSQQIEKLLKSASIVPVTNQVNFIIIFIYILISYLYIMQCATFF